MDFGAALPFSGTTLPENRKYVLNLEGSPVQPEERKRRQHDCRTEGL